MTRQKQTLKSVLTRTKLREMAGEKVYPRGEEYHASGLVNLLYYTPAEAVAEVRGSFPYQVEFTLNPDNQFTADCTCPAMQDWGFCKHAVAAASP